MSIVEFLMARIEEDEAVAREAAADESKVSKGPLPPGVSPAPIRTDTLAVLEDYTWGATGLVEIHPTRVLAECQAKRAIVERETSVRRYTPGALPDVEMSYEPGSGLVIRTPSGTTVAEGPEADEWMLQHTEQVTDTPALRDLATVYADHPDYREEWRP